MGHDDEGWPGLVWCGVGLSWFGLVGRSVGRSAGWFDGWLVVTVVGSSCW